MTISWLLQGPKVRVFELFRAPEEALFPHYDKEYSRSRYEYENTSFCMMKYQCYNNKQKLEIITLAKIKEF